MFKILEQSIEELQQQLIIKLNLRRWQRKDQVTHTTSHYLSALSFVQSFFFDSLYDGLDGVTDVATFG